MRHYGMEASLVLKAATLYYNWVRYAQDSTKDDLVKLSLKLAMERPITDPNETNIDTDNGGLIMTLKQEVDDMEEQERFPITRPESKSAVNTLWNNVKQFHFNLVRPPATEVETQEQKRAKTNGLVSNFQKVINEWNNYRRSYLNDDFMNELQLAKGEVDATQQPEFDERIRFWNEFIQLTDAVIEQIDAMLKDQLTGNPETPLEPTPV